MPSHSHHKFVWDQQNFNSCDGYYFLFSLFGICYVSPVSELIGIAMNYVDTIVVGTTFGEYLTAIMLQAIYFFIFILLFIIFKIYSPNYRFLLSSILQFLHTRVTGSILICFLDHWNEIKSKIKFYRFSDLKVYVY